MMASHYIAVIEQEGDTAFGVWFPEVEGCFSAGDTLAEAASNAAQALRQHMEALEDGGRPVPEPRGVDAVKVQRDVAKALKVGAVLLAVPLLADEGRTVRINISLDRGLVSQIDASAGEMGLTRSAFLAQAAREKIIGGH